MRKRFLPVLLVLCLMMSLLPASTLAAGNGNDVLVKESGLEMLPEKTTSEEQGGGIAADGQGESATDMPGTDVEVEALGQGATAETQEENSAADSLETDKMFDMQGEGNETDMLEDGLSGESDSTEIVESGACGENVFWTLDSEGTLEISGTGEMNDYMYDPAPWFSKQEEISKILIQDGVTYIGKRAFIEAINLTSVTIANSVISIGEIAFRDCNSLMEVTIPGSVVNIGSGALLDIISCGDGECNDQETPEPSLAPTSEPPAGETPEPSLAPTSEPPVVKTPEPSPIPTSEPAVTETPDSGQESTPEPIPTLKPSETLKPVEMPTEAPTATPEAGVDKKPAATVAPNPSQIPPSEPNQTPDPDNGELSSGAATDSSSGSGHESSVSGHSDNKDSSTNSPRTGEDSSSLWLAVLILITGGIAAVIKVAEELKRNH